MQGQQLKGQHELPSAWGLCPVNAKLLASKPGGKNLKNRDEELCGKWDIADPLFNYLNKQSPHFPLFNHPNKQSPSFFLYCEPD